MSAVLREVVYTPEAQLRHPVRLIRAMGRDLVASRGLAWRLVVRDVSAHYRQTALGYFWAIFPPLAASLAFILMRSADVLRTEDTGIPYPAYVMTGTVLFSLFVDAMNGPLKIMGSSRNLLVKVNFPREALMLASVGSVLFAFLIKLVLLVLTLVLYGVPVRATAALALIPTLGLLMFGLTIGIFLVPVGTLFQDVMHGLTVISQMLMFITPVAFLPPDSGLLADISRWNPLTPLIMAARELTFEGTTAYLPEMFLVLGGTTMLLLFGWIVFRLALPILIERLGGG